MNLKKSNFIFVTFSNLIKLISSIVVALVVPAILGVSNYGFYKTYCLYTTYIFILQFGIQDGVYLKFAGYEEQNVDKTELSFIFKTNMIIQFIISIIIFLVSFAFANEYKYIFMFLGISVIVNNLTSFFQYFSQAISRFKEITIRNIIIAINSLIIVLIVYLLKISDYKIYLIFVVVSNTLILLWYIFTYRKFLSEKTLKYENKRSCILSIIKLGIPLLISTLVSSLILSIDRQFVNILFSNEEFSQYSFAYSLLNFITVFASSIAIVLYPSLKKASTLELSEKHKTIERTMISILYTAISVYYILEIFVYCSMEKYIDSLQYFKIMLPGIVISSVVSIVNFNYFKAYNQTIKYTVISIIVLILSIIANLIAYFAAKNMQAFCWASIIVTFTWYIISEIYVLRFTNKKNVENIFYIIFQSVFFIVISQIFNHIYGYVVYFVVTFSLGCILNYSSLKTMIKSIINMFRKKTKKMEE